MSVRHDRGCKWLETRHPSLLFHSLNHQPPDFAAARTLKQTWPRASSESAFGAVHTDPSLSRASTKSFHRCRGRQSQPVDSGEERWDERVRTKRRMNHSASIWLPWKRTGFITWRGYRPTRFSQPLNTTPPSSLFTAPPVRHASTTSSCCKSRGS